MLDLWTYSVTVFTAFFAITNPIGNVPIFMSLTEGADQKEKERINKKAIYVAFFIVLTFILLGKFIFQLFNITIPAFKITGGILIFYSGFQMLQSKKSNLKHLDKVIIDENIAISPLAIPLIAGPGTIVTAMNFVTKASYIHITIVIAVTGLILFTNYIAFKYSDYVVKKVGNNIITVISKIMGLIIAIIGTSMIIDGIKLSSLL